MRTLFLTSSGLNEKTMVLFWKCIGKEPINTKAILVPSAAVGNDGAREGIIVCMERLMNRECQKSCVFGSPCFPG